MASHPIVDRHRLFVVLLTALPLALAAGLVRPALAAGSTSVSKTSGLDPTGDRITVTGSGFDESKGIYVAVCVDNGPGVAPSPCLGGVDMGGSGSGSAWISSNPPAYGQGLAMPYGPGGSFSVTLSVVGRDPVTGTDCTVVRCAAVTRADHTRNGDRSQDTRVPLSFAAPAAPAVPEQPAPGQSAPGRPAPGEPAPGRPAPGQPAPTSTGPVTTTAPVTSAPATATSTTAGSTSTGPDVDELASRSDAADPATDSGAGPWLVAVVVALLLAAAVVVAVLVRRRRAGGS